MMRIVKVLIIVIIMIAIANISYAKFCTKIKGQGIAKLKTPILLLEKNDLVIGQISKENNIYTQDFSFKNYLQNSNKVNEVCFEYVIKLLPTTENFPVKYNIINLTTNEEIFMNDKLETNKIFIGNEKAEHKYRLIVQWDEMKKQEHVDENLEVKIKIKAEQVEKEN